MSEGNPKYDLHVIMARVRALVAARTAQKTEKPPGAEKPAGGKTKKEQTEAWVRFRAELPVRARALRTRVYAGLSIAWRAVSAWTVRNLAVEKSIVAALAREGLLLRNPALVLAFGLMPLLGVTVSLQSALCMGIAALAVLLCTGLTAFLARRQLSRLSPLLSMFVHALLAAAFAGGADAILRALLPDLWEPLRLAIPMLAVSGMLLEGAARAREGRNAGHALLGGFFAGLGYLLALLLLALIRETLGGGTLWGLWIFPKGFRPVTVLADPAGALILLGILAAATQWVRSRLPAVPAPETEVEVEVEVEVETEVEVEVEVETEAEVETEVETEAEAEVETEAEAEAEVEPVSEEGPDGEAVES